MTLSAFTSSQGPGVTSVKMIFAMLKKIMFPKSKGRGSASNGVEMQHAHKYVRGVRGCVYLLAVEHESVSTSCKIVNLFA